MTAAQAEAACKAHVKHDDSPRCVECEQYWPCQTYVDAYRVTVDEVCARSARRRANHG
ncbi:hypothetical protein STSO111631_06610 [Stackebrandtia soli]